MKDTQLNTATNPGKRGFLLRAGLALTSIPILASATTRAAPPVCSVTDSKVKQSMANSLAPDTFQLLFVDIQPGLVAGSRTVPPSELRRAAGVLAKIGEILSLPMTFATVPEGGKPGVLIQELLPFTDSSNTFPRVATSPFMKPQIAERLASHGRPNLVIAGFSTEVAVLQSTLGAVASGYSVQVPVDAIGSRSERTESASIRHIERVGAITTSVLSLALQLAPDLSKTPGSEVLAALAELREMH